MTVIFPAEQPTFLSPIADALISSISPLVTDRDRKRILDELASISLSDVASLGLELTLPPHEPSCDVSVLLGAGVIPHFAHDTSLKNLAGLIKQADSGSTWWELDTSNDHLPVGAFIRLLVGIDAFSLCRSAIDDNQALANAVSRIEPIVESIPGDRQGLLGIFPTREPAAAAALVPLPPDAWLTHYSEIAQQVLVATDPHSPLALQLASTCDTVSVAVACDSLGRTAAALEFAFGDRINAMLEGRWAAAIKQGGWGHWQAGLDLLVNTQAVHTFSTFLPMTLISGINHLKITPDGRLKAYVGILPIYREVGVNGLNPGTI